MATVGAKIRETLRAARAAGQASQARARASQRHALALVVHDARKGLSDPFETWRAAQPTRAPLGLGEPVATTVDRAASMALTTGLDYLTALAIVEARASQDRAA